MTADGKFGEAVRAGLREAADAIADEVRRTAPGRLGERVAARMTEAATAEIAVEGPHAAFVEFGTRHRPARPFLTPALHAGRTRVREIVRARLETALKDMSAR